MSADVQHVFREYIRLDRKRQGEALSIAEHERWAVLKRRLNVHFQPDLPSHHADARGSVRVPVRLALHFEGFDELGGSLMTNLSRGGLFIATTSPLPIGERLLLDVVVDDGGRTGPVVAFRARAEVASHDTGADLQGRRRGMGVRFVDVDEVQRKAIDDLYVRAAAHAVGIRPRR